MMRALSVRQPWASMIASGRKTIEVRTRRTHHRGELLIVSTARPADLGPAGVALCVVEVADCRPFGSGDVEAAGGVEWRPGLWAWVLRCPRVVRQAPVRGRQGFYRIEVPGT